MAADADFNVMQASEWGVRDTSRRVDGLGAGRPLLAGLLARPARAARACAASAGASASSTTQTPPFVTLTRAEGGRDRHRRRGGGRRRERARRAADGERRLRPGRRQRRLPDHGAPRRRGANTITRRRRRPGRQPHRADAELRLSARSAPSTIALDPAAPRDAEGRLLTPRRRDRRRRHLGRRPRAPASGCSAADGGAGGAGAGRRRRRLPLHRARVRGRGRTSGSRSSAPTGRSAGAGDASRRAGTRRRRRSRSTRRRRRRPRNAWLELAGERRGRGRRSPSTAPRPGSTAGRFDAAPTLVPGTNAIEIVATDAVGQRRGQAGRDDLRHRPARDRTAATAGRPEGDGGPIEIVVEARDASGLRQAAPFVLTVGGIERRGFLRCDGAAGTCRETLPPEPGALALVEVDGRGLRRQRGEAAAIGRARGEGDATCCCDRRYSPRALRARRPAAQPAPLMVVYGPEAPTREGDADHLERVFVSVPADLADRLYLARLRPRAGRRARHPLRPQPPPPTTTLFRLSGGEGALTGAPLPARGRGRRAAAPPTPAAAGFAGGARARRARASTRRARTDDAWVTLAPFTAADGERDRRPRLVPARRDRRGRRLRQRLHRRGEPVARPLRPGAGRRGSSPTSRPSAGARAATRPRCASTPRRARRSRLQSFDGAEGEIALVSTFDEARAAGLGPGRMARRRRSTAPGGTAAITLRGGTETPNDVTLGALRRRRARRSRWRCRRGRRRRAPRPVAVGARRGRSPTAPRSPSTPRPRPATARSPIAGASATAARATRRSSPIPSPRRAATRPSSRCSARGDRVGRGARVAVPVHVRAGAGGGGRRPGDRRARRAGRLRRRAARSPSDSPITRFHWSFGDGAEAEGAAADATPTSARASTAPCCGSRTTRTIPATSASPPGSSR